MNNQLNIDQSICVLVLVCNCNCRQDLLQLIEQHLGKLNWQLYCIEFNLWVMVASYHHVVNVTRQFII
jgi:hypothetical protein